MTKLSHGAQKVLIEAGELVSYTHDAHEFIHQKGSPGWRSSDTEMFPIIGPTADAGFRVHVPRGNAIQDQHGLLRELDYKLTDTNASAASFQKSYAAGTLVENSKYPEKSTAKLLIWPFSFEFQKSFRLDDEGLQITFEVSGEHDMPYMIGYHPAFKIHTQSPFIKTSDKDIGLQEVIAVGSRALEVPDCTDLILEDKISLRLKTEGFKHFMLWTEVPNMLCVEPISFYPYAVSQHQLQEGFDFLDTQQKKYVLKIIPQLPN